MTATKWLPVSDIDSPFESISYSFENDELLLRMRGIRSLILHFSGVVALRFEQECPGFDFPPVSILPTLRPAQTFPLLLVEGSPWLEQYPATHRELSHFALISSDHLIQVLAKPNVEARWD